MIRNSKGEVGLECDECGQTFWGGTLEFREMIDDAKANGWKIRKIEDEWTHECEECSQEC